MAKVTYRRVRVDFWHHPKTRPLPMLEKLIVLCLATRGHATCIHQTSLHRLRLDIDHTLSDTLFRKAFLSLIDAGENEPMVKWDPEREIVWLVEGLDEQGFTGPKNEASSKKHLESFPICEITMAFRDRYPSHAPEHWHTLSDRVFRSSIREVRALDPAPAPAPATATAINPPNPPKGGRKKRASSWSPSADEQKILTALFAHIESVLSRQHGIERKIGVNRTNGIHALKRIRDGVTLEQLIAGFEARSEEALRKPDQLDYLDTITPYRDSNWGRTEALAARLRSRGTATNGARIGWVTDEITGEPRWQDEWGQRFMPEQAPENAPPPPEARQS